MIYNHKLINDLAWAIGSPCLVCDLAYNDNRLLTNQWFEEQLQSSEKILFDEDRNPQRIQTFMSQIPDFKLGFYFEKLIAYWLTIHPRFEIIKHNYIISLDKLTLGELDFIIKDLDTGNIIHLEVAVKFYLEVSDGEHTNWLGPNLNDRLDVKVNKLLRQQIELSNKSTVQQELRTHNIEIDQHWVLLKGRLFKKDADLSPRHAWLSLDDFRNYNDDGSQWVILSKTHWLSEINNLDYNFLANEIYSKKNLQTKIESNIYDRQVCVAKINNHIESQRIFITSNDWQDKALNVLNLSVSD